jgi:hypothetical protein
MRRKLFTVCSALSLLLCVAVCVLWAREGDSATRPAWNGWRQVYVDRGSVHYMRTQYPPL